MTKSPARQHTKDVQYEVANREAKLNKNATRITDAFDIYDGSVRIYRTTKSGDVYQFRMYIAEETRHKTESLRTRDKGLAIERAKRRFIEYQARLQNGEVLFSLNAQQLADKYLTYQEDRLSSGQISIGRFSGIKGHIKSYLSFIGKKTKISSFIGKEFRKYKNFRLAKGIKTLTTILNELLTIKHMYEFAKKEGDISQKYLFDYGEFRIPTDECKRDGFEIEEYKQLTSVSKNWHTKANKNELKLDEIVYYRKLIHDFILIMGRFGFRTGECIKLRWNDVRLNSNKDATVTITIRKENTKVRKARTVTTTGVDLVFKRIKEYSNFVSGEDFVFAHYSKHDINCRDNLYKTWKELKQDVKSKYKTFDDSLDIYGIRHYFITLHLRVAKSDMYSIARFCGTSIREIEKTYSHVKDEEVSMSIMKSSRSIRYSKDNEILIIEDGVDGMKTTRNLYDD